MIVRHLTDLESPLLDPYRELKRTNLTRWSKWFIAEGKLVVERLLASGNEIYSVLLSEKRLDSFGPRIPEGVTVLVVSEELANQLVGYDFHTGIMACGVRPLPRQDIDPGPWGDRSVTLVVCPATQMPDNLGAIIRNAAAFGVAGLIIGAHSADPYSRRVVRVSMGNIFLLPVFEPRDLVAALEGLKREGFSIVAANQSPQAIPLPEFRRPRQVALVLGNEASGIPQEILTVCDTEVEIPLAMHVDSLNVSTASAVILYELTKGL